LYGPTHLDCHSLPPLPLRTDLLGELARAAQEVRVDVRLRDRDDAQALARRGGDVAVDVALGVEHDRLAGALAADQVGVLGELRVVDLSEEHGGSSWRLEPGGSAQVPKRNRPLHGGKRAEAWQGGFRETGGGAVSDGVGRR
jgi:hypothetical protein